MQRKFLTLTLCIISFLCPRLNAAAWTKTVAADGSGDYRTVNEAILAAPMGSPEEPATILIKAGTYNERLYIQREKRFLRLLGEKAETTTLAYNLHARILGEDGKAIGTFRTPSTYVDADDFHAENITFANTAGPVGQALAIRIDGDRVSFRGCRFLGWQDTILTNRGRHYFENCTIEGHVDFIFGGATAYFEGCTIRCLRDGYVTAASTPKEEAYGYVFNHCRIQGANPEVKSYLGRPWRVYAHTVFMNTEMDACIRPVGWNDWGKPEAKTLTRYGEFANSGPGAQNDQRPTWIKRLSPAEAEALSPEKVLAGTDGWSPRRENWRQAASK